MRFGAGICRISLEGKQTQCSGATGACSSRDGLVSFVFEGFWRGKKGDCREVFRAGSGPLCDAGFVGPWVIRTQNYVSTAAWDNAHTLEDI